MQWLLSAGGALLLGHTVRYLTGNVAGLCTFGSVLVCSIFFDRKPALFFLLACGVWAGVYFLNSYALQIINLVPICTLVVLLLTRSSTIPTVGLFIADLITLIFLAYRGWANKRLLD